jgi:predicted permease
MLIHNLEILEACRKAFSWKQISTVLILAIGLTLTTVMFAVGYGYSVFSVPFKDAGQIVTVGYPNTIMGQVVFDSSGNPRVGSMQTSLFFDLKERKDVFTDLAAHRARRQMTHDGLGSHTIWQIMAPRQNAKLTGLEVTDNYFDVFGVSFQGLHEWKQQSKTSFPVPLIVSHGAGEKNFGVDAIGREFDTDSDKITLFGILPEGFLSIIYTQSDNFGFSPLTLNRANNGNVQIIARLAQGVTPKLAEQMLSSISHPSAPVSDDPMASRIIVRSVQEQISKPLQRIVIGAWLLGGFILILCIANISGIYLMRCNYQMGEFALKSALGANFLNLVRPLYFELIILASISAVIAAIMVQGILTVLANIVPLTNMSFGEPASGWIVFFFLLTCMIFMVVASLTTAVIFVLKNYRQEFNKSNLTVFHSYKTTRMLLIISQAMIAMLLLAISNMAVRGYLELFNKDIGVDSSVVVATAEYSLNSPDSKNAMAVYQTLEALRGGSPDSQAAVCVGTFFSNALYVSPYSFKGEMSGRVMYISPGFVNTVNGRLLAGREFNEKDRPGEVILINAALAGKAGWSPHESIGQVVQSAWSGSGPAWLSSASATVIGVVGNFLNNSWEDNDHEPTVFLPISPKGMIGSSVNYIVHPDTLRRTGMNIEQTIYKFAPEAVITRYSTWYNLLNSSASGIILATFIVVIFAIAAIIIVVTGIVNTILFTITKRMREIAIHIAMGASTCRVFWLITSDVVKAGSVGLLIGALMSWWVGKASAHFFYNGAQYFGLLEIIVVSVLLLLIVIIASLLPALRILHIEINRALVSG